MLVAAHHQEVYELTEDDGDVGEDGGGEVEVAVVVDVDWTDAAAGEEKEVVGVG